ncbi:hypothetical protein JHK82_050718 [Glycine max]|uniref:DUF8040 domain-containing protein n=1 Tax=Glycine max TaxID=3847 RepID=A0A0R0FCC1_SOYBN|nr:hypothetical protein JHK86_050585 [Glycine max]KAG4936508.1 hypothetical protein JHK85_051427 [Glycine max]KAG5091940.1 hypothetical protein JHK82_050718 [Glycine max]KAG5095034.1 hypothetical protein JHK84_050622 [Glycine max]
MSSSLSSNDLSLSSNESSSDDDDHFTRSKVLMLVVANVTSYFMNYVVKNPCRHSSMTSHHWVYEILNGHPIRCYQMFRTKKLIFLELCKYYLLDSSYPTFMGFLGPNKKTRYHLPQFKIGPRIRGRVEFFNYYHSSLRSTIEHDLHQKILGNMPPFALKTQNQIIVACMAIHNFIQRNDKSDGEFNSLDEDNKYIDSDEDESEVDSIHLNNFILEDILDQFITC